MDYEKFFTALGEPELQSWAESVLPLAEQKLQSHGDVPKWADAIQQLPSLSLDELELNNSVRLGPALDSTDPRKESLQQQLMHLHPWRKGPFDLFGVHIDTEWRSDWKWDRVRHHIADLKGRRVLDVGCGNGYHCWRMAGAGAKTVIGIDPTLVFVMQYQALQHYINSSSVTVLPLGIDEVPKEPLFDTVFSMGVLYHRRSPLDHLLELKALLRPGGQLVLETLVIQAGEQEVLVPQDRYAQMRNVWFIPSTQLLQVWLRRCGYNNVRLADVNVTSTEEQRSTAWMTFQSLQDYLQPQDHTKTVEGYPAPVRAVVIAERD